MTNSLIASRDRFAAAHPETKQRCDDREWGVLSAGFDGPAIVLLPGTLGRADIFWQQIEALEGETRILALSYPSNGGVAEWADDIAAITKGHGLQGAAILGSSLGGYVAQYAAACHPAVFGALIAANTLPDTSIIRDIPPYAMDLETVDIITLADGFLGGLRGWMMDDHPYRDLAHLLAAEVEGRIPEAELRNRLIALKTAPALPPQSLPRERIFTVESEDDHLIPPPVRQALRAALVPAETFNMGEASHFPYVTRPGNYTAMLRQVLGFAER